MQRASLKQLNATKSTAAALFRTPKIDQVPIFEVDYAKYCNLCCVILERLAKQGAPAGTRAVKLLRWALADQAL